MWSWTFCRLCPAKSCSLLTLPDITTNTQLENSPEPDRTHCSSPSQWNGCAAGTPTRRENRATDSPRRLSPSAQEASPSSMHKVRYQGPQRPEVLRDQWFPIAPITAQNRMRVCTKVFYQKNAMNVTIGPSEFVTSIPLQGVQSPPNSGTTLPQEGSHHTWPKDKWEASNPAKTDAPAESVGSQHALSDHSTPLTLTSQK